MKRGEGSRQEKVLPPADVSEEMTDRQVSCCLRAPGTSYETINKTFMSDVMWFKFSSSGLNCSGGTFWPFLCLPVRPSNKADVNWMPSHKTVMFVFFHKRAPLNLEADGVQALSGETRVVFEVFHLKVPLTPPEQVSWWTAPHWNMKSPLERWGYLGGL